MPIECILFEDTFNKNGKFVAWFLLRSISLQSITADITVQC